MRRIYISAIHDIPFLPYVYGLLRCAVDNDAALARDYTFGPPIFLAEPLHEIVSRLEDPDVVGFSCYVWNLRRQMKLARLIRERFPACMLVVGGPHVPASSEAFLRHYPFIDVTIHGEGEIPFLDVLRRRGGHASRLSNEPVVFHRGDDQDRARRESLTDPLRFGSPYLRGYLEEAIDRCRGRRFYGLWETNRGCPYSCTFCDWGSATMSRIRRVPDAQIEQEIEYFGQHGIDNLFICDANFGILPRDLDIARKLADARAAYGSPRQVRVNFAKESNDRVFEISRIFCDAGLSMGTTLSMQSMDMDVLQAVQRRNIGYHNFEALARRYRDAGIPTYSELILGLPNETRNSFEEGIGNLLEAGHHDDIRVFDFMILPNSPVNTPDTFRTFGLKTVQRQMYVDRPEDENEIAEIVVATATMSLGDWIACQLFAQAIQMLHNGCYTRYLAMYLRRQYGIQYVDFYRRIVADALEAPSTVLGSVLQPLARLYRRAGEDGSAPYNHLVASDSRMLARVSAFGMRKGWTPDQWGWLSIAAELEKFVRELEKFVERLGTDHDDEMEDVLRYQADIVLRPEYDPTVGKRCRYDFDLPTYFAGGDLVRRPTHVWFRDTYMGANYQYPLEKGEPRRFAKAAVGESYPMVRVRHYQHQLSAAEITYDEHETFPEASHVACP